MMRKGFGAGDPGYFYFYAGYRPFTLRGLAVFPLLGLPVNINLFNFILGLQPANNTCVVRLLLGYSGRLFF